MADYCAKADIHNRLQDLSTDYDTLLDELCSEATQLFNVETGRRFDSTTATKYFSGRATRTLFIPDLASLTTVRLRTTVQGSWRVVPVSPVEGNRLGDVILGPEDRDPAEPAGYLKLVDAPAGVDFTWPPGSSTVEIAGSWGYAAVPVDVKEACVELVVSMLRDRGVATGGQIGVGDLAQDGRVRTYPDVTYRAMRNRKALLVA